MLMTLTLKNVSVHFTCQCQTHYLFVYWTLLFSLTFSLQCYSYTYSIFAICKFLNIVCSNPMPKLISYWIIVSKWLVIFLARALTLAARGALVQVCSNVITDKELVKEVDLILCFNNIFHIRSQQNVDLEVL